MAAGQFRWLALPPGAAAPWPGAAEHTWRWRGALPGAAARRCRLRSGRACQAVAGGGVAGGGAGVPPQERLVIACGHAAPIAPEEGGCTGLPPPSPGVVGDGHVRTGAERAGAASGLRPAAAMPGRSSPAAPSQLCSGWAGPATGERRGAWPRVAVSGWEGPGDHQGGGDDSATTISDRTHGCARLLGQAWSRNPPRWVAAWCAAP